MEDDFLEYVLPGGVDSIKNLRDLIAEINRQQKIFGNVPTVLLVGETGAGKTFAAQVIAAHAAWIRLSDEEQSYYREKSTAKFSLSPTKLLNTLTVSKFDEIYLPVLTDDIASSELFGHVRGAFTGAVTKHPGRLGNDRLTDILLDEVGDASPRIQAKLLQLAEGGSYTPVGGTQGDTKRTEARLIFATHRDLNSLVATRQFREDLYWRLQGMRIFIPPLRECRDAIPDLVHSLVDACKKDQGKRDRTIVASKEDVRWCKRHEWPGNLRELRLVVWQFIFEEGRRSFERISVDRRDTYIPSDGEKDENQRPEGLIHLAISVVLQETLAGKRKSFGTVGKFTRHFDKMVRSSLYRCKGEKRLTAEELQLLFSRETIRDIHTKIGRFRPNAEAR